MKVSLPSKILIFGALLAAAFGIGFFSGKKEVIKTQDRVVYKDRIVTVTKTVKPDGTVIEETKTEDKEGSKIKVVEKPSVPRFSAGIMAAYDFKEMRPEYGATAGMRLVDNFWAKSSFLPLNKIVTLGLEYQF